MGALAGFLVAVALGAPLVLFADGTIAGVDTGTAIGGGGTIAGALFAALWVLERLGYLKRASAGDRSKPDDTATEPRSPSRTMIVRELEQDQRNERLDRLLEDTADVDWSALAQTPRKLDEVLERLDELADSDH